MTSIANTYQNALLADATYALGADTLPETMGFDLERLLKVRMTPTLAKYIGDNFTVVTHIETGDTLGSGFDATVWRDSAGKLIVSMQGSSGLQDFLSDIDLAITANARAQLVTMINWWLRETAPNGAPIRQIVEVLNPIPGTDSFAEGNPAVGTGRITASALMAGVEVNGHSLGGYLASAFMRLFGSEAHVTHTSTFNSAGFAPGSEKVFTELQNLIGVSYGLGRFPNGSEQSNYFAKNGLNVTTNSFWFNQVGTRVDLYNESDTSQVGNHFMYKLTDSLALGNALNKLDPTFTVAKMNALLELGGNNTHASIEGTFDALRKVLAGPNIQRLPISDASDSDASRVTYHETLAAIQTNPIFIALTGNLRVEAPPKSIGTLARFDFGALIALQDLSPLYVTGNTAAARDQLAAVWQVGRASDYAAWSADKASVDATNFTDHWMVDRAALLQAITVRNKQDNTNGLVYDVSAPSDRALAFQWYGADPLPGEVLPREATLFFQRQGGAVSMEQRIIFGDETANTITGTANLLGDHLYGGAGIDNLSGLIGPDYLEGGTDDDTLNGGAGGDMLVGGAGNDTYQFTSGEMADTIRDSDGNGTIMVGTAQLTGGKKDGANYWVSDDLNWGYMLTSTGDLVINNVSRGAFGDDRIVVQNWLAAGGDKLGIVLSDTPAPAPVPGAGLFKLHGDQALLYSALIGPDDWLNLAPDGTWIEGMATPGSDDFYWGGQFRIGDSLYADRGPIEYDGWAGNDVIIGYSGADKLSGGEGNDVIFGASGSDRIDGGAGKDFIMSNSKAVMLVDYPRLELGLLGITATPWIEGSWDYPVEGDISHIWDWTIHKDNNGHLLSSLVIDDIEFVGGVPRSLIENPDDADFVLGGAGDDFIWGGLGQDIIDGEGDKDALRGDDVLAAPEGWLRTIWEILHTNSGLAAHTLPLGNTLFDKGDSMSTQTSHQDSFTQPRRRTRRASVPARLRARGRGACGARPALRQHHGLRADSVATANWLRRSGTATRHVCGFGWLGEVQHQAGQVHSMRVVSHKWLGRRMDAACWTEMEAAA